MNKIELTGKAYDIVIIEQGCCVFDLEFEDDKFITVGCIDALAVALSKKFTDGMKIDVTGKICIDTEEEFIPYLSGGEIFIKADDITFDRKDMDNRIVSNFKKATEKGNTTPASDFTYVIIDNKAVIAGYSGIQVNINIPSEIDGFQTEIAPYAFKKSILESVILSEGITTIPHGAFQNCNVLKSVVIPESVSEIADCAFWDCEHLEKINIPNGIKKIGTRAFAGCQKLSEIILPDGLEYIGEAAFNNSGIRQIHIPFSVTYMGKTTFLCCYNLMSVRIEGNFDVIEESTFQSCEKLVSVTFGDKCRIKTIGKQAFYNCKILERIKLPDSLEMIETEAFMQCRLLSNIEFPDKKVKVRKSVFIDAPKPEITKNIKIIADPIGYYLFTD